MNPDIDVKEVTLNGETYVRKCDVKSTPEPEGDYVIVRTYSAGVHAGYLENCDGKVVMLMRSRRLWRWDGAASISQLAVDGTSKPSKCKFPCEVPEITLTEAIEIVPCTTKARESIQGVAVWSE